MPRDLARLLRWRHASFRRRRLPFLIEVWVKFPLLAITFPIRKPSTWLFVRQVHRAAAQGETVIQA